MDGQWQVALGSQGGDSQGIPLQAFSLLECLNGMLSKKKSFKTSRKQKIENMWEQDTTQLM